jgi:uncharacterized membrane protein YgcG
MNNSIIIAAEFDGNIGDTAFWDTGLGSALGTFLGVLGILVVIYAIVRTVKNVAQGKLGEALKGVIGAVLLAAVLFQPTLAQDAIKAGSTVMEKAIDTISSIGESSNGGTGGSGGSDDTGGSGDSGGSSDTGGSSGAGGASPGFIVEP